MAVIERERVGQQSVLKRVLVGRRHPSSHLPHTLLPKILALPIFSSDPLSSVAYATEQIMVVFLAASATSRHLVIPISLVIAAVLAIVVISYRSFGEGIGDLGGRCPCANSSDRGIGRRCPRTATVIHTA